MIVISPSAPAWGAGVALHAANSGALSSMTREFPRSLQRRRGEVHGYVARRVSLWECGAAHFTGRGDAGLRAKCWQDGVKVPEVMTKRRKG